MDRYTSYARRPGPLQVKGAHLKESGGKKSRIVNFSFKEVGINFQSFRSRQTPLPIFSPLLLIVKLTDDDGSLLV